MGKQATIFLSFLSLMEICLAASPDLNSSTDEHSILAIKSHIITSYPNNILASNWSVGTDFCTWIGVTCSRRRPRITALNLFNMSLEGTIAKEIGNFSFLTYLNIRNNSFNGVIPDEIGNLRRLRVLEISFNQLSGGIPLSFGLLTNLKVLSIQGNHLTDAIPRSIFNISSLQILALTHNQLSGTLPMDICYHLSKLEGLHLSHNQLSGNIPTSLSACSRLKIISLSYNNFIGPIPMQIGNLSQLQQLVVGRNKITEYGSRGLVSTFVDVYSYGILLMETFTKKRPTDELFLEELSMKRWVFESFPNTIMQIVDTELLNADEEYSVKANIEECLVSIMELAIECATDLPDERPNMKDVHVRLKKINFKVAN